MWATEVVRFSSQFSRCQSCFVWSGAEATGCNQANPASTSTCQGAGCAVAYGEPLSWGDSSCTEIAWQANQIIGPSNFYPGCASRRDADCCCPCSPRVATMHQQCSGEEVIRNGMHVSRVRQMAILCTVGTFPLRTRARSGSSCALARLCTLGGFQLPPQSLPHLPENSAHPASAGTLPYLTTPCLALPLPLLKGPRSYVSGFELYETYKPGATYQLSTAPQYTDDNTVACCGADAAAARPSACAGLPICSRTTAWNAIWSGSPGNSGEAANIFSPPVCPCTNVGTLQP